MGKAIEATARVSASRALARLQVAWVCRFSPHAQRHRNYRAARLPPVDDIGPKPRRVTLQLGRVPPTLNLHGRTDSTVDCAQSTELAGKLEAQDVPHELILLDGDGRTFDLNGWDSRPHSRDIRSEVVAFLERYLR